jgi:hypothetical protein
MSRPHLVVIERLVDDQLMRDQLIGWPFVLDHRAS